MKPGGISCKEVVELITAYLDGALSPELAERVRVHLELHPDRDALLATFRSFSRTLDS